MHFPTVRYALGNLLIALGICMLIPIVFSLYYQEDTVKSFLKAAGITLLSGSILRYTGNKEHELRPQEGIAIVFLSWICASLFGMLPYVFSGVTDGYVHAIFESVSGFTTTGISIFPNLDALPKSLVFWRAFTNWLGGMGILILFIALLTGTGGSSVHMFRAEFTGPVVERIKPRIRETARILWLVYVGLTLALSIILYLLGMSVYDAIIHSFGTTATAGISSKSAGLWHYTSPAMEWTIILFMFLSGTKYALIYLSLTGKSVKTFFADEELRFFVFLLVASILLIFLHSFYYPGMPLAEFSERFRYTIFKVVSVTTTTGFYLGDLPPFSPFSILILTGLMLTGACVGTTCGGLKMGRLLIMFKTVLVSLKQFVHPRAVITLKINNRPVSDDVIKVVFLFFFTYVLTIVSATLCLVALGIPVITSFSAVIAAISNGGLDLYNSIYSYSLFPTPAKIILILTMLMGRLEIFTLLIALQPGFWRSMPFRPAQGKEHTPPLIFD
ncbi:MAG: TrkH family potassium uptake protein [Syntrophomonadaceae bacterium]|nr:TrkH family potassium uptake protein [Syntrophomonadaceae bacterium]